MSERWGFGVPPLVESRANGPISSQGLDTGQSRHRGAALLTELTITGYKSYDEATLPLSDLTVLVGTNASGKSNALEVIELLGWVAQGRGLGELPYALGQGDLRIRGSLHDFHPRGVQGGPIRFRAVFREPSEGAWEPELRELVLDLSFNLDTSGQVRIIEESLTAPHAPGGLALYGVSEAARAGGAELQVWYNNLAQGGVKPKIPAIAQQPVFMQLTTPARLESARQRTSARLIPSACQHVRDTLRATILLAPVPSRMREYSFPHESRMQSNGRNLSAVLLHVCGKDPEMASEVLSFVRNLPDQSIDQIGFVEGPRGEVMASSTRPSVGRARRSRPPC